MKKVLKNIDPSQICKRLQYIREMLGFNTAIKFAAEMGIKYTTYQNYEKNRVPTSEFLLYLKEKYPDKVDLSWILTGQYENIQSASPEQTNETVATYSQPEQIETEHQGLVKLFKNKPLALEINRNLIELEKLDESELKYIKGVIDGRKSALEVYRTLKPDKEKHG
jgi:transcriptional regulator with XRE-family HTH domain